MSKDRTFRQKRKKATIQKVGAAVLAAVLVVAIAVGLIPNETAEVLAAEKVSDLSTITKYTESLGATNSTEYAGRVWTDKTVWAEDSVEIEAYGGAKHTVTKNEENVTDEDFLIGFSALATSQSISGHTQAPLDVVFIIDLSGSMSNASSKMDNGYSRIYNTVQALNRSIESLMELNEYTRVGVVGFSNDAEVLLPLDHYSKSYNQNYFSLNRTIATSSSVTLTTRAVGDTTGSQSKSTSVSGGTNIQRGFYVGMDLLASASSTTVTINGKTVTRVPSVVLLGDGSPTYSSSAQNWWAPTSTSRQGSGSSSSARYGNGFKAMMTASWMKAAIDAKYGVRGTTSATKVYTIGMGIDDIQYSDAKTIARVTLNPEAYWSDNNTIASNMRTAWNTYVNGGTPRVTYQNSSTYTVNHPSGSNLSVTDATFRSNYPISEYVDKYYSADKANDVDQVFENIVNEISISAPQVPTEHDARNPMNSGFITYTDPIGEYMEVKNFKAIIYGGVKYTAQQAPSTDGNVTTYVFTEEVPGNEVYKEGSLSNIRIKVTTTKQNGIKKQVLTIEIPAGLIPLRINSVELNADNTVRSHTNNGAYPIRVLYTVGLQHDIKEGSNVAFDKISEEYLAKHLNDDGTVDFYSNLYTGTNVVNGSTAGDATVVFDAAPTNPFYYMQENQYLYIDPQCTILVNAASLDDDTDYYYKETHYEGTRVITDATKRTGAQLTGNTVVIREVVGPNSYHWYRPAGTVRVNRMLEFEGTKSLNGTGTAEDFYAPTYNGTTGHFTVYLGNNGKLSVASTGSLEISKTVTASEGLTAPDANFTFNVNLEDASGTPLTGSYAYTIVDAEGHGVHEGTVSNGGTITLKAGQTAKVLHLPPNASYTVEEKVENMPAGFAIVDAEKAVQAGTIVAGSTAKADYENHYSVTPLVQSGFTGTKVLEGRQWAVGDEFTFFITPYNNAPLPEDYDLEEGVTVTSATNNVAEFDLGGDITFRTPGIYRYTVYEREPDNNDYLPGMSYSRALYRIVITVVDNGDGTMSATPNVQKLYEDDATALFTYDAENNIIMNSGQEAQDEIVFTNTYSAESVTRTPVALKAYTDNSGQKLLVSGMFQFKLTPLGIVENREVKENTASSNPMPLDAQGNKLTSAITENEGHNVTFPAVTFTENDIPDGQETITYRYQMEEVIPEEANSANNYTVNGMKYDSKKISIDVTVSKDPTSHILDVNAVYPNDERITTFTNEYTPAPVSIEIKGEKTLTGRDMKDGEVFEFNIVGANAATNQATTNGTITIPSTSEQRVSGGTNGAAVPFSFGEYTFNKPGTFTFNITETKGNAGGVTYDGHTCTVTVVVSDENGQLTAAVTYSDNEAAGNDGKAIFKNTYTAVFDDSTAISLYGTKKLTGRPIIDGEFYFEVKPLDGAPVALAEDIYVPAAGDDEAENGVYKGAITFLKDVTYENVGEYKYEISEFIPTITYGVTYDTSKYVVTVNVTDNLTGMLQAAVTKIEKGAEVIYDASTTPATGTLDGIVFDNKYKPNEREYPVNAVHKVLAGNRPLAKGEFEFERTVLSADPTDGIALYGPSIVGNEADGTIQFDKIVFTKAGTYTIQIKEVIPEEDEKVGGVTYDDHVFTATFTVTDDLSGNLVARRTGITGSTTFRNVYESTGTLSGATNLQVTKILDLDDRTPNTWGADDKFTFVLEAGDDATKAALTNGTVVLPTTNENEDADVVPNIVIDSESAAGTDENANDKVYVKTEAFGDITFKAAGTYKFIIRELAGTDPGMDYDVTSRTITVTTTDKGDGTLNVSVDTGSQTNPKFTNVYNPDDVILPGHGNLHVNKVLEGRPDNEWSEDDSFTFILSINEDHDGTVSNKDNIIMPSDGTTVVVNKDNKDHVHFGNITFKAAGTFQFVIDEVLPTGTKNNVLNGITYDTSVEIVEVKVVETDGVLSIESVTYDVGEGDTDEGIVFKNTYDASPAVIANIEILKTIVGRDWTSSDAFDFKLGAYNDAAETGLETDKIVFEDVVEKNSMELKVVYDSNAQSTDTMAGKFGKITFYEPGIYSFVIDEVDEDTANMSYDKHNAIYIVEVVDDGNGQLVIKESGSDDAMTWENTHIPTPVNVTLNGKKIINGRNMTENDRFHFQIGALDSSTETPMPDVTLVQSAVPNNNEGAISFGPIKFTKAGTYEYYIYEHVVNEYGITSDTGYVRATVEVTYNDTTGELTAKTPTYRKVNSAGEEFTFINNYSATGVLDGSLHLNVTKNFTGRQNNAWLLGDEFAFTLDIDAAHVGTKTALEAGYIVLPENAASGITIGHSDVQKHKAFGDITFTQAGEYQFIVTETVPSGGKENGITYDKNPSRTIYVDVTDNGDGTLKAVVNKEKGSQLLTFDNVYGAEETKLIGATNLVVEKKINGRDWIPKDTYTFALSADVTHTSTNQALAAENIVMPEKVQVTITDETHKDAFGDITFKEAGTYRFVVSEVTPADADKIPGIAYATRSRVVYVNVVDNHNGTMTATVDSAISESLVFVNTYTTAAVPTNLVGTKKIAGRDLLATDKFQFTISKASGSEADTPLPETVTVENDANGTITFGPINFTKAGTYKYVITEEATSIRGITDSTQGIDVTVKVVDNYNDAQLKIESVTYEAYDDNGFVYTNTYTTDESNPISITAKKTVTPKEEGNSYTMKEGDFGFQIAPDVDHNKTSDPIDETTVYNDAEGNVVFVTDVEYTEPGDYIYYIEEVAGKNGTLGGFDFDDAQYTVTVHVEPDYENAKLIAEIATITKTKDDKTETVTAITFDNIYNPEATSEEIKGTKELTVIGSDKVLEDGDFKFKLEAIGDAPMPEGAVNGVKEVTNTAKAFSFGSITYTVPNTYKYKVTEVPDNTKTDYIDYDETVYEVTIKVEDVNGELTVTQNSTTTTPIEFENTYEPVEVTLQGDTALKGKKVLDGRDLDKDEFTFQLLKSENGAEEVVMEVKNDADGNFKFEPITFKEEGTFYYIIKEMKGTLGGVTYDETPDSVKIVVSDDNGYLKADVTYENSENERADFKNTYKAEGTEVTISATKKLSGRDLRANEFTFILMDEEGNQIETVKNAADGTISFTTLEYEDGEEGTYVYKVAEVKGGAGHITYDEKVYEITVTITDNKEGKLVPTLTVKDDEELIFNNAYTPADAKVTLSGKKILMGRDLVAEEFTFLLKDAEGKIVGTAKNNANGTFAFDEIVFTQVGTFQYVVEEDSSAAASGITYDKSKFDVVIKVTDNGEGQLVAEVSGMDKVVFTNAYESDVVKTGDTTSIMPIATMLILSAGYILVSFTKARKR